MASPTPIANEEDRTPASSSAATSAIWPPLLVSLLAVAGSLWLSIGMGLKACPLCFYQRTFVMSVFGVLVVGLLTGPQHRCVLNLLALPLAVAGFGVAAFHVYLELTGKLECPTGVLGLGSAPQQSLAVLTLVLGLVVLGVARNGGASSPRWVPFGAATLGLVLAIAAIASAPPMPGAPKKPYETPLEICRPPYSAS